MGRTSSFLSLPVLAIATSPASAATLDLEPASEWRIQQYDDKCRASRDFGSGEDAVALWLEQAGPSQYVNMTAIGRPFRSPYGARVALDFGSDEPVSRGYISNTSSQGRPVLVMFGVSPISLEPPSTNPDEEETVDLNRAPGTLDPEIAYERYDAVRSIDMSGALVQRVSLKIGSLANVMSLLRQCVEKRQQQTLAPSGEFRRDKGPRTRDETTWASQIQLNYPSYLLREMAQSTVAVRVQINPDGRATFCEILGFSGPAGFNDAACLAMLRHSRFRPAENEEGNPTWGAYSTRITYRVN